MRVLVLGALDGARAGGVRLQHLHGAVRRERARERRGHGCRVGRRDRAAAGRAAPAGSAVRQGRRSPAVAPPARARPRRRTGGRAPSARRTARGRAAAGSSRGPPGRTPTASEPVSSASSPIAAPGPRTRSVRLSASTPATARRRPRRTTIQVLGLVPFADQPLAGEHAAGVGVGRERLERLRVRAGEERDARQRRDWRRRSCSTTASPHATIVRRLRLTDRPFRRLIRWRAT